MIAKGPNMLNLNAYTQGQQQTQYNNEYEGQQQTGRPNVDSKNIEDQFDDFLKELNKYDDILNNVAQNIEDLSSGQLFITDFYPPFIVNTTYETDEQKKIIASTDPEMLKILISLQRSNRILKDQMKGWMFQFAKKTQLSETLLSENSVLRKALTVKNKQIVKLIQTISNAENEQIVELKQNLQILQEQNGLLLDHLQKMKEKVIQKRQDEAMLTKALQESNKNFILVQKQNQQIQDRQQHLSKTVVLLEDSLNELQRRRTKLDKQKTRLTQLKLDYKNDQSSIQSKVESCEGDKNSIERELKAKFETHQDEKNEMNDQIQELTQKIQKQKEQTRYFQSEIQRNQNRLMEFNRINKQYKVKNENGKQIILKLKGQFQKVINSQAAISSQIDIMSTDIQILKSQLKSFDDIQKQTQLRIKSQLKSLEQHQSKSLNDQKSKQTKFTKDLMKRIFEQKLELSVKQKQISEWSNKVANKHDQIKQLKQHMKQIRSNQAKANQLKAKVRSLQLHN